MMRSPAESQDQVIVDHLRQAVAGVIAVYRFGSTARGTAAATSDTDIALLARSRLTAAQRFEAQEALAAKLGCDVDLVDLAKKQGQGIGLTLVKEILTQHGSVSTCPPPEAMRRPGAFAWATAHAAAVAAAPSPRARSMAGRQYLAGRELP